MPKQYKTIDDYIKSFPQDVQQLLEKMRQTIHEEVPEATEAISYQMPAFKLNGNLVWFAALKNNIGFYPKQSGIEAFAKELAPYKSTKSAVQFPMNEPVPYDLVRKVVRFGARENLSKKSQPTY
jgi:uncharacterized protein YdhG (YjbR/CyaY superfamily)